MLVVPLKARSGDVVGVEALIRWPQADGGMLPPGEFLPRSAERQRLAPLPQLPPLATRPETSGSTQADPFVGAPTWRGSHEPVSHAASAVPPCGSGCTVTSSCVPSGDQSMPLTWVTISPLRSPSFFMISCRPISLTE